MGKEDVPPVTLVAATRLALVLTLSEAVASGLGPAGAPLEPPPPAAPLYNPVPAEVWLMAPEGLSAVRRVAHASLQMAHRERNAERCCTASSAKRRLDMATTPVQNTALVGEVRWNIVRVRGGGLNYWDYGFS